MKELTAKEAIKYPIGTKFKVNRVGTVEIANVYCTKCFRVLNLEVPKIIGDDNVPILNDVWLNAKYVKIQEPVSFMEAVADPNNRVKVVLSNEDFFSVDIERFNKYRSIKEMLKELTKELSSCGISKAINKGRWYVEK